MNEYLHKQQLQVRLHRQNIDNLEQHLESIVMHMNVSQFEILLLE